MTNNCIFSALLFCNIKTIIKCINSSRTINIINTQYLWKLLCERDHELLDYENFVDIKWHNKYKFCCLIKPLTAFCAEETYDEVMGMDFKGPTVYKLYNEKSLSIENYKTDNYNNMHALPINISNMTSLISIDLSYNLLLSLPSELLNMAKLEKIYVYKNNDINVIEQSTKIDYFTEFLLIKFCILMFLQIVFVYEYQNINIFLQLQHYLIIYHANYF